VSPLDPEAISVRLTPEQLSIHVVRNTDRSLARALPPLGMSVAVRSGSTTEYLEKLP